MDAEIVKAFELVLVLGCALAVAGYEIWHLRRTRVDKSRGETRSERTEWYE